jgi:Domain of unknown function (DUF4157)
MMRERLRLQRSKKSDEAAQAPQPLVESTLASGGRPLDPAVRASMEPRFGHDFSNVQVHTDSGAAASADAVAAHAYTVGPHVVFNSGQYAPESDAGQRLIAHELAHVVQQSAGPVSGAPMASSMRVSEPGDPYEREADAVADAVMAGEAVALGGAAAPEIQREADDEEPVPVEEPPVEEEV